MKKTGMVCVILGLLCLWGLAATKAEASSLYGSVGPVEIVGQTVDPGSILTIDQTDASSVLVGDPISTPDFGIVGIDFDSTSTLYGVTRNTGEPGELVRIDKDTGALLQTIGTITDGGVPIGIMDLAFQPGTDVLFGVAVDNPPTTCGGCLFTIDVATGVATLVGDPGLSVGGIAFAPDGTLYMARIFGGSIVTTLNPATAAVLTSEAVVLDPPFDTEFGGFFDGLAVRPEDGVLFATHGVGVAEIFVRNPTTQTWAPIGASLGNMTDLAFLPDAVPVPSLPGTAGILLVTLLLLAVQYPDGPLRSRQR